MSNNTSTFHTPFRADFVGSFLRPAELKEARAKFANSEISQAELRAVEDILIADLVAKQKQHGLHSITDGEFRRSYWHLDFMWGFGGVEHIELEHGYQFHGIETTKGSIRLTGKITGENHPFIDHFRFVKQFEEDGVVAKQTIPAPAQMLPSCSVARMPTTRAASTQTPKSLSRTLPAPTAPSSANCMPQDAATCSSMTAHGA